MENLENKHYVYRITNIKKHRYYIGKRSMPKKFKNRTPKQDLGVYYFSSSNNKGIIKNQKKEPQNWKYKIIKTFKTQQQAIDFEIKIHKRLDVQSHRLFYNNANQTKTGYYRKGKLNG